MPHYPLLFSVITTIQEPTDCVKKLAAVWPGNEIIIAGDRKGPFEFGLAQCRLLDINSQTSGAWKLSKILPERHYARKNLGYLEAMKAGADCIYETDDDNEPLQGWQVRTQHCKSRQIQGEGWYNVYREFTASNIWPRGLPLNKIRRDQVVRATNPNEVLSPIQQGLANGSPDVDAIWRLVLDLDDDFVFEAKLGQESVRLQKGLWCPFNSQSTWWWPSAFALMYLPSYCSFRMTDIWRSFVAQRCLWEMGFELVFHGAEVLQKRNPHDAMKDFSDEIPGYEQNAGIAECLGALTLKTGEDAVCENLQKCYRALVSDGYYPEKELKLVEAWCEDIESLASE